MSDPQTRFLHTADWALDAPLGGLTEVPDALRDTLIDAPYIAAERVTDVAIEQQVAAVLVAGELADSVAPSPRALSFLRAQFERLAGAGIFVFWAGPLSEPMRRWLELVPLPESVHVFAEPRVERVERRMTTGCMVHVLGRGGPASPVRAADFRVEGESDLCLALAAGPGDGPALSALAVDYWALGGCADRKTLFTEPRVAHFAGTPQGRRPDELGPHGCTVIELRPARQMRLRFVPCDAVRWQHERVILSSGTSWEQLSGRLSDRVRELQSQSPTSSLLARWTLVPGDSSLGPQQLRPLVERARQWLSKPPQSEGAACWTVSIEVEVPDQVSAGMYEEDTLLGDYLRALRRLVDDESAIPTVAGLSTSDGADLSWLASPTDPAMRARVVRDAAELGAGLLRGEDVL